MKVTILCAKTGNGHISVAEAIRESFVDNDIECAIVKDFYESMSFFFQEMSDFYNLLQMKSRKMCAAFSEMILLEGDQTKEKRYAEIEHFLDSFFMNDDSELYISVAPLINYYIVRFFKEHQINKPYYVVVTDPYNPIFPGFSTFGANLYFVPNNEVKSILIASGISDSRIKEIGYPVKREFIETYPKHNKQHRINKTIFINSGAHGLERYFKIIEIIKESKIDYHLIVTCGNNTFLYNKLISQYVNDDQIEIYLYINQMNEVLSRSDICVTKPGANSIYECIYKRIPVLIDCQDGMLFQEKGIIQMLEKNKIGEPFYDYLQLPVLVDRIFNNYSYYIYNLEKIPITNACNIIASIVTNGL